MAHFIDSAFWYFVVFWLGMGVGGCLRWHVIIRDLWSSFTGRKKPPTTVELKNFLIELDRKNYYEWSATYRPLKTKEEIKEIPQLTYYEKAQKVKEFMEGK